MENTNDEIEIDLLRMVLYVLHKWKFLLLSGLIFAVLGGFYKYYTIEYSKIPFAEIDKQFPIERVVKQLDGRLLKENVKVSYNLYKEDYFAKRAEYEEKVREVEHNKEVINDELAVLDSKLRLKKFYLDNSVLYKCNPENYLEKVFYYSIRENAAVKSKNTALNIKNAKKVAEAAEALDSESSVQSFARTLLFTPSNLNEFAKALNLPTDLTYAHISELIGFSKIDSYSFTITLKGDSEELISKLEAVKNKFDDEFFKFYADDYIIKVKEISSDKRNNLGLIEFKITQERELADLEKAISDKQHQLDQQVMPLPYEGMNTPLIDLEKFKKKKIILFSGAGFAGGLFLALCIFGIRYLFSGKLRDDEYLTKRFGIMNLATVHATEYSKENNEELEKLKESVLLKCRNLKSVAILSSLRAADCTNAGSAIKNVLTSNNVDVCFAGISNVLEISGCDGIILLEKLDVSSVQKVSKTISHIMFLEKNIIGIAYA